MRCVLFLLILSQAILLASCNDDEFAEFDDLSPEERGSILNQMVDDSANQPQQPKQSIEVDADSSRKPNTPAETKLSQADEAAHVSETGGDTKESEVDENSSNQKRPDLKLVNVPSLRQFSVESYYVEIAFLFATLLYLINFFLGSAKNLKYAQDWYDRSRDLLKQQFALVGGSPTINDGAQKRDEESEAFLASMKKQKGLIKSSESLFTIWNSGRVGMEGMLVEINLLKRQDLFSMALNLLKANSRDTLTLRFQLGQDGYENFVFCLAHKTQATRLARDMVDINTFCQIRKPSMLYGTRCDKIVVMTELSDVCNSVFDDRTIEFLNKYEKSFNYIHITDRYSADRSEEVSAMQKLATPKRIATFSFSFPKTAEESAEFISYSLSLLDRLRKFKPARDSKNRSEKNRRKISQYIEKAASSLRQEAAQAKKEELRRLEKEKIYNEDDPEKQRRWEKKEAKREQKRNKMRLKQLKVKSM